MLKLQLPKLKAKITKINSETENNEDLIIPWFIDPHCHGAVGADTMQGYDSINKIEEACSKNNFPLGYHVINPNYKDVLQKKKLGYTFLGFSLDFLFLGNKARDEMNKLKNEKK